MSGTNIVSQKIIQIDPDQPFNPTEFIGKGWTIDEEDERDLSFAELDLSKIQFETCLKENEFVITGEEKLRRLKAMKVIRHGGNIFLALWQDYKANNENSGLKWIYQNQGVTHLDFFGLVMRNPVSFRHVPSFYWRSGRWFWRCLWLDRDWWRSNHPSAVSTK
ncbi:MAG: hypothetical protein V1807_02020 [Patescibacteria group bacterium]